MTEREFMAALRPSPVLGIALACVVVLWMPFAGFVVWWCQ